MMCNTDFQLVPNKPSYLLRDSLKFEKPTTLDLLEIFPRSIWAAKEQNDRIVCDTILRSNFQISASKLSTVADHSLQQASILFF